MLAQQVMLADSVNKNPVSYATVYNANGTVIGESQGQVNWYNSLAWIKVPVPGDSSYDGLTKEIADMVIQILLATDNSVRKGIII